MVDPCKQRLPRKRVKYSTIFNNFDICCYMLKIYM